MYHSIIPVTKNYNPIVIEGQKETQVLLFNAGPNSIQAKVWQTWNGKQNGNYTPNSDEPNLQVELRSGNQIILSGAFIRVSIKLDDTYNNEVFAALGVRILHAKKEK